MIGKRSRSRRLPHAAALSLWALLMQYPTAASAQAFSPCDRVPFLCEFLRERLERLPARPRFLITSTPTKTQTPTTTPTSPPSATPTTTPTLTAVTATHTATPTITAGPPPAAECQELGVLQESGSIVVLPKVIVDDERDTAITLSNVTNLPDVRVRCFYVNGAPVDPSRRPGPDNPPLWTVTEFTLRLTAQQPTQWIASRGRAVDPTDPPGSPEAGIDPGLIPPLTEPFTGELTCVQVDDTNVPLPANALTAEATLLGLAPPVQGVRSILDISKYNGIAIRALNPDLADADSVLELDDIQYGACPRELRFTHIADPAEDPVLGPGSSIRHRLTLVPCHQDLSTAAATTVMLRAEIHDEFEVVRSVDFPVNCWLDENLQALSAAFGVPGGGFLHTKLTPIGRCLDAFTPDTGCTRDEECLVGRCERSGGVLGVLESVHSDAFGVARASRDVQSCGSVRNPAFITLP